MAKPGEEAAMREEAVVAFGRLERRLDTCGRLIAASGSLGRMLIWGMLSTWLFWPGHVVQQVLTHFIVPLLIAAMVTFAGALVVARWTGRRLIALLASAIVTQTGLSAFTPNRKTDGEAPGPSPIDATRARQDVDPPGVPPAPGASPSHSGSQDGKVIE